MKYETPDKLEISESKESRSLEISVSLADAPEAEMREEVDDWEGVSIMESDWDLSEERDEFKTCIGDRDVLVLTSERTFDDCAKLSGDSLETWGLSETDSDNALGWSDN